MAKPLTSWLVTSFSQHNRLLVVSGRFFHVSVTKFQDKFASLQQVNSPNNWNEFQICCTGIYLIRFLPNFAGFRRFTWISRLRDRAKNQKPCFEDKSTVDSAVCPSNKISSLVNTCSWRNSWNFFLWSSKILSIWILFFSCCSNTAFLDNSCKEICTFCTFY